MDLSQFPALRDAIQRGLVKDLSFTVPRGGDLLNRGREADAMQWLRLDPALPVRRRSVAIRRALRDVLLSGRTPPAELFSARLEAVAVFEEKAGIAEAWFVPKSTRLDSEIH